MTAALAFDSSSEWADVARALRAIRGSSRLELVAKALSNVVETNHFTAQQAVNMIASPPPSFAAEYTFVRQVLERQFGVTPGGVRPVVVPTAYDRGRRDMAATILDRLVAGIDAQAIEHIRADLRAVLR